MDGTSTLRDLLLMLSTLTNEPVIPEPPIVMIVPDYAMPCTCEAAYDETKLYLRNDINWTDPRWLSVVLHELVHHRQFLKHGTARGCADWIEREREALLVQTEYLERMHSGYRPFLSVACR